MSAIYFDTADDASELVKALTGEGYRTDLVQDASDPGAGGQTWRLAVEPFDDRVVEMVDVYGGWLPGDDRLPD